MSSFTVPLKRVISSTGIAFPGLMTYPIFDETDTTPSVYRPGLNQKIVNHFWNREIGQESIELFLFNMERKMNEIMPFYNQVYLSTQIKFDPLATVDLSTIGTGSKSGETDTSTSGSNTGSASSETRSTNQDFPQNALSGNADYASSGVVGAQSSNSAGGSSSTGKNTTTDTANTSSTTTGYQGIASELLMRYRASLINTDMMVIQELEELFMLVWTNPDDFSEGAYFL